MIAREISINAMADVLRFDKAPASSYRPAPQNYLARVTERPEFTKAHAEQIV
jgi:hypothetical protein